MRVNGDVPVETILLPLFLRGLLHLNLEPAPKANDCELYRCILGRKDDREVEFARLDQGITLGPEVPQDIAVIIVRELLIISYHGVDSGQTTFRLAHATAIIKLGTSKGQLSHQLRRRES